MRRGQSVDHPNIVEIGGKPYYVGMQWDAYANVPSRSEIREEADIKEALSYALREGQSAVQVAFCDASLDDLPKGTASLAAYLADSARQPWLGLFEIAPDRWWYIAVRDHNAVLPDGDVVGTEAEALAARDAHSGFTDWHYLTGNLGDLERLINETKVKAARLRSVRPTPRERKRMIVAAGTMATLLSVAIAGAWYVADQQEQETLQTRRLQAENLKKGKIDAAKNALVSPFYLTPAPGKLLTACREVFATTPVSLYGWSAEQIVCTTSGATINWVRGEGATVRTTPEGSIADNGEQVTQSIAFQLTTGEPETLAKLDEVRLALLAWAQEGGFTFRSSPIPAPAIPEGVDAKDLPPQLPAVSIQITTPVSPFALQADLESYPGLRLTSLKEGASGWTIEGTLYGQR